LFSYDLKTGSKKKRLAIVEGVCKEVPIKTKFLGD
jgi:hypothetical protein